MRRQMCEVFLHSKEMFWWPTDILDLLVQCSLNPTNRLQQVHLQEHDLQQEQVMMIVDEDSSFHLTKLREYSEIVQEREKKECIGLL